MKISSKEDIILSIDGKKVMSLKPIELSYKPEPEREFKNGDSLSLFTNGISMTLSDVQVNEEYINKLFNTNPVTVVVSGFKYPRGNKLPKKKRIRKKWMKKYHREYTYDNCMIY